MKAFLDIFKVISWDILVPAIPCSVVGAGPEMRGARSSPSTSTLASKILLARLLKPLADQKCFFNGP